MKKDLKTVKELTLIKEVKRITLTKEEYDKLEVIHSNRPFSEKIFRDMGKSVVNNGCLRDVIVVWSVKLKKYLVIDGQHLTKVLQSLNSSIPCRVVDVKEEEMTRLMIDINNTGKSWNLTDYIHSWGANGIYEYKIVENYIKNNKIQETVALMAYTFKDRPTATKIAKAGTLVLENRAKSERLLKELEALHQFLPNNRIFNQAMMTMFLKLENFDHNRFMKNVIVKAKKVNFSTKEKEIYNQLVELYNA